MFQSILKLFKHSAIYGIGHILSRSITILLLPLYTNFISLSDYSIYVYGYAFLPFIAIFYTAGINNAQIKFYVLAKTTQEKFKIIASSFWSVFVISLIFSIILIIFSKQIASLIFNDPQYAYLIYICCGILIADSLYLILSNILRAEEKSIQFIVVNLTNVIINLLLNFIFIIKLKHGVDSIFWANLFASIGTLLILFYFSKNKISLNFSMKYFIELFKFGFPLIFNTLGMILLIAIDRFIIREIINDNATALYGAGYKLGMFMALIVTAFNYAWHPFYLSLAKNENEAKPVFAKVLTYFLFVSGFIILMISIFIKNIVQFKMFGFSLIGEEYWDCTVIVPIILLSYIFYGMYVNFQVGIFLKNKTKYLAYITSLSAVLNIIANLFFVSYCGIIGAAYATVIAYFFMALSLYFLTNSFYKINYEWIRIAKLTIITILLFIAGTLSYFNKSFEFKLIFIPLYFILLYFIGFFEKNEMQKLKDIIKGTLWQN